MAEKSAEDHACHGNWPTDENNIIRYEEGVLVRHRHYDKPDAAALLLLLSYMLFALSNPQVSGIFTGRDRKVEISSNVTNAEKRAANAMVQFYIQPPSGGPVARPTKELTLDVRATEEVFVQLDKYAVSFYDVTLDCW
jgi:hypothetical protein